MLLWIEGFELVKTTVELAARYTNVVSSGITFDAGRIFGTSLKADHTALQKWRTPALAPAQTTFVTGFGFKATRVADNVPLVTCYTAAGLIHVSFEVVENSASDFVIKAYRDGGGSKVLLATTSVLPYDAWLYLELLAIISNTGGKIRIKSNGSDVVNTAANLDTQTGSVTAFDTLEFSLQARSAGQFCWIDDSYVLDISGTVNNNFLGDQITEGLLPVDDGDESEWTPNAGVDHFAAVDDATEADGDSSYLAASVNDRRELFRFGPLTTIGDNISGVQRMLTARLTVAGSRNVRHVYLDAADAEALGPTKAVAATSYAQVNLVEGVQPDSGVAWTPDDINSGQFGFETVA